MLVLVDVGLLSDTRGLVVGGGFAVLWAVPQQATAFSLFGFQGRLGGLQLVNELSHVGLVVFPEKRHGYSARRAVVVSGQSRIVAVPWPRSASAKTWRQVADRIDAATRAN